MKKPVVEEAVQRAVQELVQHYSQPVHHEDGGIMDHNAHEDEAPYFDELLGGRRRMAAVVVVPPVVQHWVNSLLPNQRSAAAAGVAKCYQCDVRSALVSSHTAQHPFRTNRHHPNNKGAPVWKETTLPVLVHYELLLAQLILIEAATSVDTTEEQLHEKEEEENNNDTDGDLMALSILAVTQDIQSLVANISSNISVPIMTNKKNSSNSTQNMEREMVVVRNKILPTLLRVLMHMVHLMPKRSASSSSHDHSIITALTEATVTALTCMTMKHNTPRHNHTNDTNYSLVQSFCLSHMVQNCAYPPPPTSSSSSSSSSFGSSTGEEVPSKFLTSPVLPEQRLRLELISSQLPWMDTVSGISTRAAWGILRTIHSSIVMGGISGVSPLPMRNHEEVLHGVFDFLGVETLAQSVRAHFFGRSYAESDSEDVKDQVENESNVQTLSEWDRSSAVLVSKAKTRGNIPKQMVKVGLPIPLAPLGDRGDDSIPLYRVHVALVFLQVTIVNDEKLVSSKVLSHMLPMLFTLIDSSNKSYTALGAVGLYHVLRACTPTTIMEHYDSIVNILKDNCRTCRDGVALPLLATARAQLYCVLGMAHDGVRKDRRTATMELLSILKNQSYKQMEVEQCMMVGLLVGGIHPLLVGHAENESFIVADSMEMARLGLSALLSLLEWDYGLEGRRIQMAAMCALISLMMGAHPILPRHGGKIMTQLMTCIGRANQDGKSNQIQTREEHDACHACLKLALHTASVALILCDNRAEQVLTMIETKQKTYPPYLVQSCAIIRQAASHLLQNEN